MKKDQQMERREEMVARIVPECKKLAQNKYKNWRHDRVALIMHWHLRKKYGIKVKEKWYQHGREVYRNRRN